MKYPVVSLGLFIASVLLLATPSAFDPWLGVILVASGAVATICYCGNKRGNISYKVLWGNIIFLVAQLLLLFFSTDRTTSLRSLLYFIPGILMMLCGALAPLTEYSKTLMSKGIVVMGVVLSLIGWYFVLYFGDVRLGSLMNNANVFGSFLLLVVPFSYYWFITARPGSFGNYQWWFLVVTFIATVSRGSFVSVLVVTAIFLFFGFMRVHLTPKKIGLGVLVFVVGSSIFLLHTGSVGGFAKRLTFIGDSSFEGRAQFIIESFTIGAHYPLTGTGLGTFKDAVKQYQTSPLWYTVYPHNIIAEWFAELGVWGVMLFLGLVVAIFIRGKRIQRESSDFFDRAVFFGILAFTANMLFEVSWHYSGIFYGYCLLLGVLFSQRGERRGSQQETRRTKIFVTMLVLLSIGAGVIVFLHDGFYQKNVQAKSLWRTPESLLLSAQILYSQYQEGKDPELLRQALVLLTSAIQGKKFNGDAFALRALVNHNLGNTGEAEQDINRAIQLDRFNNPIYYATKAVLFGNKGKSQEAIAVLEQLFGYYPTSIIEQRRDSLIFVNQLVQSAQYLSELYAKLGNKERSQYYLQKAREIGKIR